MPKIPSVHIEFLAYEPAWLNDRRFRIIRKLHGQEAHYLVDYWLLILTSAEGQMIHNSEYETLQIDQELSPELFENITADLFKFQLLATYKTDWIISPIVDFSVARTYKKRVNTQESIREQIITGARNILFRRQERNNEIKKELSYTRELTAGADASLANTITIDQLHECKKQGITDPQEIKNHIQKQSKETL